jgi:lipid II:glycine glycyltransferase (peptidoglycan interpeptide bridge formation enzyme)
MMKILKFDEINKTDWENLVERSSVATWFQTSSAYSFYRTISFFEPFCFGVESDGRVNGVIVGFVLKDRNPLKNFFSRRAIVYGGPLLADDIEDKELAFLLTTCRKALKKKAIYLEFRNLNDYSRWKPFSASYGFQYQPHYDIHINTSSMDVVNENMGKSRKRDIRVSMRDGASIITDPTLAQVREFYVILKNLYETKVRTPLFPLEFFEKLYEIEDSGSLLVQYEGKIVGGMVCVGMPGVAVYEMYVCGMDGVYKNIFPSEVATYAGLKFAAENGYPKFDMMGAGAPDDGGYGVRDFKLKFGGELLELGRVIAIYEPLMYRIGKIAVKIMKIRPRLPFE